MSQFGKDNPLSSQQRDRQQLIHGVVTAIVTGNVCRPDGGSFDKDYRVRVSFPWLPSENGQKDQSFWARIATMGAGPDRGVFWLPEIDDEVLVIFVNGEFNQPVVIGSLWNGVDKPTYSNKDASGKVTWAGDTFTGKHEAQKNDLRAFTSRKFHQLVFNDNASEPRVALHSSQKHRIVLDDKGNEPNKIEIYDGKEENYILIDTKNKKITIESKTGDILIKAKKTLRLECETFETKSDKNSQMEVGQNFDLKVSSNMTMKASGQGDVESSGTMIVKGSTVNIN